MSFDIDMSQLIAKTQRNIHDVTRDVVSEIGIRLVDRTPTGDPDLWKHPPPKDYKPGHAKKNWVYSTDAPMEEEIDGEDPTGAEAKAKIVSMIPLDAGNRNHYLSNSVPYIWRLENGWSTQSPPHAMVAATVSEFRRIVNVMAAKAKVKG